MPEAAAVARHAAVADHLRERILSGAYRPGERLPAERQIASHLGVNRASVREGLRKLEQLGLVHIRRGGGATVCRIEDASLDVVRHLLFVDGRVDRGVLQQVLDVYEIVLVGAARLAVERGGDDELFHARDLLRRLADPRLADDAYLEIAESLVDLVARASGNLVLQLCRNALDPFFGPHLRGLRRRFRPGPALVAEVAGELEAAVAARDVERLERAVRRLLRDNRERLARSLDAAAPH